MQPQRRSFSGRLLFHTALKGRCSAGYAPSFGFYSAGPIPALPTFSWKLPVSEERSSRSRALHETLSVSTNSGRSPEPRSVIVYDVIDPRTGDGFLPPASSG